MRRSHKALCAMGMTLALAAGAGAATITFDFSGNAKAQSSVSESETAGLTTYTATATGQTYAGTNTGTSVSFNTTPTYGGSGAGISAVNVYQVNNGVGVDSPGEDTTASNGAGRLINSYATFAEVLWISIAPPSGYTITSAKLVNISTAEVADIIDGLGNALSYTITDHGTADSGFKDLAFSPPSSVFGIYDGNTTGDGIKLSQVQITLSPANGPIIPAPASALGGGILLAGLAAKRWRSNMRASK